MDGTIRYTREIVHSPKRFEQWHFTHTILQSQQFALMQVRQGGYGVHDTDFWVERIRNKGFSIVILCISGKGRFLMEDGTELVLNKGEAFVSGPDGQGHREETLGPEPFEHIWLMLSPESPILHYPDFDYRILEIANPAILRELIRLIISEDLSGSNADKTASDQAERLFMHLTRRILSPASDGKREKSHKGKLTELWNQVAQHLDEEWCVEDLCKVMNCSRSQLTRLCREYYSQSPGEKVKEMKMEYAKILLTTSTMTIREIAESVGFDRFSVFSSSFSSYAGMSPREYRKNVPVL